MRKALLVPRAALPYLDVAVPARVHHAELAPLRREALDVLAAGYRSTARTLLGVLAGSGAAAGATLLAVLPWQSFGALVTVLLAVLGGLLLAGGLWLSVGVLSSGRRITGAAAAWLCAPATGAADGDATVLLGVLRWRAVLAAGAAAATVVLTVVLGYVLTQTGLLGAATPPPVDEATRVVLVAALAVGALTAAAVTAGTAAGVRTVAVAAWLRPAVVESPPPGPAPHPETFAPVEASTPAPAAGGPAAGGPAAGRPGPDGGRPGPDAGPGPEQPVPAAGQPDEPPTVALDLSGVTAAAGAAEPATADATPAATAEIVLPDGRVLGAGTTLVGRRPQARPEDVIDDVVTLTDQTVTKTHAAITVEGAEVRVVDRASTNGTLLEAPDGALTRCRSWQVTPVRVPAIIHLGRTRLHVRAAAARVPLEVA